MLIAEPRKQETITLQSNTGTEAVFTSELCQLRVQGVAVNVMRITFTAQPTFEKEQSLGVLPGGDGVPLSAAETAQCYQLSTGAFALDIAKENGQIAAYACQDGVQGEVLFAEAERRPHQLEAFDYYKTLPADEEDIIYIDTPDGKKPMAQNAKRAYERVLYKARQCFVPVEGECLYGLGQHTEGYLNLRGTTRYLHQANMKIAMPLLISSQGYGILYNMGCPMIFEDNCHGASVSAEAVRAFDYYIIKGAPAEIIAAYRMLTGKASLLPRWAYGFIQSQERYETQAEILDIVVQHRARGIGLDGIVLDWMSWEGSLWGQKTFDASRFPNPSQMMADLHAHDAHFMVSVWPNMQRDGDNAKELAAAGHILPNSDLYNVFSPAARAMFARQLLEGLYAHGVDSFWNDSCEPVSSEWGHGIDPTPAQLYANYVADVQKIFALEHGNEYALYHAKTIYDALQTVQDGKRVLNLTRSAYTGQQRYGTVLWSGDTSATWRTLHQQITEGLSFVASGHPWWTLDIGGFFVKRGTQWHWDGDYEKGNQDLGYRELYTRWYQYGAFLPMFRSHGTDTRRETWLFGTAGTPFYDTLLKYNRLRYALMPTLYAIAGNVWRQDTSFMAPLYFHFMQDEAARGVADQFMVGDALMVCPITTPMYYGVDSTPMPSDTPKTRVVYFPAGAGWFDFETNAFITGGQSLVVAAPLAKLPLYVRAGGILLFGAGVQHASEEYEGDIVMCIYDGADGTFAWYTDAGDGEGYAAGEYALTDLAYHAASKTVSLSARAGCYAGMAQQRKLTVMLIGTDASTQKQTMVYDGQAATLTFA